VRLLGSRMPLVDRGSYMASNVNSTTCEQ